MGFKKRENLTIKMFFSRLQRELQEGADIGMSLILLAMFLIILFFITVPVWLIFYPWGQIFTTFSVGISYLFISLFFIYFLFHFFIRSSVWIVQGKIGKHYGWGILFALAFGLWFSDLITMVIPASAEVMSWMLCPDGYQNFATEMGARRYDMPGVVVSYGLQDMQCTGELGSYRPRQYHMILGSFLLAALPMLTMLAIIHLVEKVGKGFDAPWAKRGIALAISIMFVFMLGKNPTPIVKAAKALNTVFTMQGGYRTWLHKYAEDGNLEMVRERIEAGDKIDANAARPTDTWKLTPIYHAISNNNIEIARILLENGADPDIGLLVPLHLAVTNRSPEMVSLLLEHDADIESEEKTQGFRALSYAAMGIPGYGTSLPTYENVPEDDPSLQIMKILLENGARTEGVAELLAKNQVPPLAPDIMAKLGTDSAKHISDMGQYMTPYEVKRYIFRDKLDWLESYLAAGGDPNTEGDGKWGGYRGLTLLGVALVEEKLEAMEILLEAGAAPEKAYGDGTIHWAAANSSPKALQLLIDAGADPMFENSRGKTPYDTACDKGNVKNAAIINKVTSQARSANEICKKSAPKAGKGEIRYDLEKALRANDEQRYKKLVKKYKTTDVANYKGVTLLMEFAEVRNIEAMKMLLHNGAKMGSRDKKGNTVLHWAIYGGRRYANSFKDVVAFLAEKGAKLDVTNNEGNTVLHELVSRNKGKAESFWASTVPPIKELLKHRANLSIKNKKGKTPLMLARDKKEKEIEDLLLKAGASK